MPPLLPSSLPLCYSSYALSSDDNPSSCFNFVQLYIYYLFSQPRCYFEEILGIVIVLLEDHGFAKCQMLMAWMIKGEWQQYVEDMQVCVVLCGRHERDRIGCIIWKTCERRVCQARFNTDNSSDLLRRASCKHSRQQTAEALDNLFVCSMSALEN